MTTNISNIMSSSENIQVKAAAKNNEGLVSGFQSIMSNVSNQNYNAKEQESYNLENSSKQSEADKDVTSKTEVTSDKKLSSSKETPKKLSKTDKSKDNFDEVKDEIKEVVDSIKSEIQESLNITEQQLSDIMETLGLTNADLLDNQNVLQIVMEQLGITDNVSLFDDQTQVDMVKGLMEQLQNIKSDLQGVDGNMIQEALNQLGALEDNVELLSAEELTETNQVTVGEDAEEGELLLKTAEQQSDTSKQGTSSDDSMMNNSYASSNTAFNNLTQALMNSQQVSYTSQTQAVDIINQIVEGIKSSVKQGTTQLDIQLNPESLGKVNVTLVSREGLITAQISAQTEAARHAIESQIMVLKDAFQSQGLKVEAVEVSVSPQGFDMQQQEGSNEQNHNATKSRRQINLEDLDLVEEDLSEEESVVIDMMQHSGSSVDFSA